MTACFTKFAAHKNHCSAMAAACSPARISIIMDTVIILAVSIFVCLVNLCLVILGPVT